MRRKFNTKDTKYTNNVSTRVNFKEFKGSTPHNENISADSQNYEYKAFKNLQNVGIIETKADPNAAITKGSYPYNIIAQSNKVLDANYAGSDNIDGNSIVRLQNSNNSDFLNIFDVVSLNKRINYLYLCYIKKTGKNNLAANVEMAKSIEESLSKAYSTMLTQLPFYTQVYESNMPTLNGVSQDTQDKMNALLHYQTVLQNIVAPLSKYIQTRSLEQTLMNMSYRRESAIITDIYGLLKKSAFIATLNAIGTSIIGDYFDVNWYKQMNTLMFMASRKSNSMTDPLITSTCTTAIPSLKMGYIDPEAEEQEYYYDSANMLKTAAFNHVNPDTFATETASLDLETLIYQLVRMLDVSSILKFARMLNTNPESLPTTFRTPSAYYDNLNRMINQLTLITSRFTSHMTEIRTFLDKSEQSGLTYWKKGLFIDVGHITDFTPDYNQILHHVLVTTLSGSSQVIYDLNTLRWQAWTMWNKYTGIAQFDRKSGGAFITFGVRELNTNASEESIELCIPRVFAKELFTASDSVFAISRTGLVCSIGTTSGSSLINNSVYSRLNPLNNTALSVKIPVMDFGYRNVANWANIAPSLCSAASQLLLTIFGYGDVKFKTTEQAATQSVSALDPDFLCFIDVQIDDVSNDMITFCRNYAPFRVQTPNGKRTIGFGNK